jgi:hypothetical protein
MCIRVRQALTWQAPQSVLQLVIHLGHCDKSQAQNFSKHIDDSWVLTVDEGTCCIPAKDDPGPSPPLPSSLAASRQVPGEAYNSGSGLCYVTGVQMCTLSVHMGTFSGWQIRFQIIEFRCNEQL